MTFSEMSSYYSDREEGIKVSFYLLKWLLQSMTSVLNSNSHRSTSKVNPGPPIKGDPRVDQERARGFPHLRTQGVILKFAANINTEQQ